MRDVWGVDEVALAIVSHRHADHYGGLERILRNFPVKLLVMNMEDCPNRTTDNTRRRARRGSPRNPSVLTRSPLMA